MVRKFGGVHGRFKQARLHRRDGGGWRGSGGATGGGQDRWTPDPDTGLRQISGHDARGGTVGSVSDHKGLGDFL